MVEIGHLFANRQVPRSSHRIAQACQAALKSGLLCAQAQLEPTLLVPRVVERKAQEIDGSGRSTFWSGSDGDCRQTARFDPEQVSPQRPIGSFTCTRLEGLSLHANSFGICNLGKHVRPAKSSRMAYGTSSKDGIWLRNHVQALASACCEEARSCFILHDKA